MSEPAQASALDDLSEELVSSVRRAAAAVADASLVAQLGRMRGDLDGATRPISECMTVLLDSPLIELSNEQADLLSQRRAWVTSQIAKVREALAADPASLRKGSLWRETKQAVETIESELVDARAASYAHLLDHFAAGDRELLETLPPQTPGKRDYQEAIEAFEAARERLPSSVEDTAEATAAGRRLQKLREQVESDAVPEKFQEQWRALRADGLALGALTPEFRAWLDEHGLARSVVLRYRAS